jgi:hypothetical protein
LSSVSGKEQHGHWKVKKLFTRLLSLNGDAQGPSYSYDKLFDPTTLIWLGKGTLSQEERDRRELQVLGKRTGKVLISFS